MNKKLKQILIPLGTLGVLASSKKLYTLWESIPELEYVFILLIVGAIYKGVSE
jgi:hypothetical protein